MDHLIGNGHLGASMFQIRSNHSHPIPGKSLKRETRDACSRDGLYRHE